MIAMQRWEYKVRTCVPQFSDQLECTLNVEGLHGWELVGSHAEIFLVFKREVDDGHEGRATQEERERP